MLTVTLKTSTDIGNNDSSLLESMTLKSMFKYDDGGNKVSCQYSDSSLVRLQFADDFVTLIELQHRLQVFPFLNNESGVSMYISIILTLANISVIHSLITHRLTPAKTLKR